VFAIIVLNPDVIPARVCANGVIRIYRDSPHRNLNKRPADARIYLHTKRRERSDAGFKVDSCDPFWGYIDLNIPLLYKALAMLLDDIAAVGCAYNGQQQSRSNGTSNSEQRKPCNEI